MEDTASVAAESGALTLLFTDIEGSTSLWVDHPDEAGAAIALHDEIIARAIAASSGRIIKTTGDGVLAGFASLRAGVLAATDAQLGLARRAGDLLSAAHVRMALHAGTVEERAGDLFGLAVNKCQRIMAAASAGQILLSSTAAALLRDDLPPGIGMIDLGRHRLRGIPGAERLYQLVHAELRRDFPALATSVGVPTNLPAELTSFVGREQEVSEIRDLLNRHRLVTLVGEGGAGKTRLAIEVASAMRDRFADGVWLVELDSLRDPGLVAERVASTLGLEERAGLAYDEVVADHLRDKEVFLVVDNCEHLLDSCARLVVTLLGTLPDLRVLATSRQRLGAPSEMGYRVPPMSVPGPDSGFTAIATHDSVRLFVERARLASPAFRLSPENAEEVGRICRRLDGIPLALELAAAKAGVLTVREIAAHLDGRFRLLTGGARTAPPRHQTIEAAVEWSYDLLPEVERRLFARLAVFRGGFDLPAAEQVCADDGERGDVVAMLAALVDKSMVVADIDVGRYRLLETMREFGAARLAEDGATGGAARRHAEYFLGYAQRVGPELDGPDQAAWLSALEVERDNLRAAMEWSLDHGGMALRFTAAIWKFWLLRRRPSEGRDWLARSLAIDAEGADPWRVHALLGSGQLASNQGDHVSARALLAEAQTLAEHIGDTGAAATALAAIAVIHHKEGDLPAATAGFTDALDRARSTADALQTSRILTNLALVLEDQGRHQEAGACAEQALDVARTTGVPDVIADALLTTGEIAMNQGDAERARGLLEEALRRGAETGVDDISAWARSYLGRMALQSGEFREARALLGEAIESFRDMESPMGAAWALRHLALAELRSDEPRAAEDTAGEALRLAHQYVRPEAPDALQVFGEIAAATGRPEAAGLALAVAQRVRADMELRPPAFEARRFEATWEAVSSVLSPDALAAVTDRAASLSLDEAVEFTMSVLTPRPALHHRT